jgi:hypothetical protein
MDGSRLKTGSPDDIRDRCIVYMLSLLAENERSQRDGAVLFYKVDSPPFDLINVSFLQRLTDVMPLRFKSVHLLSLQAVPADVASQIRFAGQTHIHVNASKAELSRKLNAFGITKAGLPKCVNGEWGYEKFVEWQELRTRMEWKIPIGLSGRASSMSFDFPAIKPYAVPSETEPTERKRRLNVIHSRRKRDRERIEMGVLQEQCSELREEKERLFYDNRMLEDLTRTAKAIAARGEEKKG